MPFVKIVQVTLIGACTFFLWGCLHHQKEKVDLGNTSSDNLNVDPIAALIAQIKKDSTNPNLHYRLAEMYVQKRQLNEALLQMSWALQYDSLNPNYYIRTAEIYMLGNHAGKSKQALEQCLQKNPNHLPAKIKLAELFFYVKKYEQAMDLLDDVLKMDEHNASVYYLKGLIFKEKGDTNRAVSSFITSTEQNQDDYFSYEELGVLYAKKHNKLAVDYFQNALRINPKSVETLYNLGKYYQDVSNFEKAKETYSSLLKIAPNNGFAQYNLGAIAVLQKNIDQAIECFSRAILSNPNYAEAYFARGLCYLAKGERPKAVVDFKKTLDINPSYTPAQDALKQHG